MDQKTWLITGCSSGLGWGIALAALQSGGKVAVTARNPESLQHFVEQFSKQALPLRLDLNDEESMKQAVEETYRRFGSLDILVNNAGHGYRAAIEESQPDQVAELFQTNFFGPMELIQLVLPKMREARQGMIVNVSFIGAVRGALGNGYYSAAKGALELATEALAKETQGFGIRTMLVEPGAFRTGFYEKRLAESTLKISDYDGLAVQYRKGAAPASHDQLGDPERGGRVIVQTIFRKDAPFRLLLGSDAVNAARTTLENRLRELHVWEDVSRQSDFPKSEL